MNKKAIKPVVLSVLFLAALIFFSITTNQDNKDLTAGMPEATLPVVQMYQDTTSIAQLHGYLTKMDVTAMRDTVIPIDKERQLPMRVDTYGKKVDAIRYEIRSLNGERLVARSDVTDYSENGNEITATLSIQNILEKEQEYALILVLVSGKQEINYYTRLMQTENRYAKESMDFAFQFHDYTFRDDADKFIPRYMDPATGDASTLNYVDLSCTLKQITWADLAPMQLGEVQASYKEINDSYNVIVLSYVVTTEAGKGETEYYNVEEYYRLRMTENRMYVLNFERTLNQLFRGENTFIYDTSKIQLGIRSPQIEYAVSETGDVAAFVQEGELWCFDRINSKIVKVFSFHGEEGVDIRDNWNQHEIKIARVDEAGSIDFVVYGYMNRGEHEGTVGTSVYHYDGLGHTIEEEVFIPSQQSYGILKSEMGQLLYVSEQGILYLLMNRNLYQINLNTLTPEVIIENLKETCYKISDSNQYFAWVDSEQEYQSEVVHLMNLKDGSVYDINEGNDKYVRPLGFINDDFIFGAANQKNVRTEVAGNTVFPMDYLKIMGTSEESRDILKTYQPKKGKIDSISVSGYTVAVYLVKKSGSHYVASGADSIMNREANTNERISVESTVTDRKETQYQLVLRKEVDTEKIKMLTSRTVLLDKPRLLTFEDEQPQECFYVYAKGKVVFATENIADAVLCANEQHGVVTDSKQQYIWMNAYKSMQEPFKGLQVNEGDKDASSVVQAVSALLNYKEKGLCVKNLTADGKTPKNVLEQTLTDSMVLDVSGCSVNDIIFYVGRGNPVFAMTSADTAVLVTGYNASRIYYYDPVSQETLVKNYEDADEWFTNAGNIFFALLDS